MRKLQVADVGFFICMLVLAAIATVSMWQADKWEKQSEFYSNQLDQRDLTIDRLYGELYDKKVWQEQMQSRYNSCEGELRLCKQVCDDTEP